MKTPGNCAVVAVAASSGELLAQKMVVVLKSEGMVLMPWLHTVPALLEAWYPGEEDGNAVADILFGVRNPSGKLPMTFYAMDSITGSCLRDRRHSCQSIAAHDVLE